MRMIFLNHRWTRRRSTLRMKVEKPTFVATLLSKAQENKLPNKKKIWSEFLAAATHLRTATTSQDGLSRQHSYAKEAELNLHLLQQILFPAESRSPTFGSGYTKLESL